MRHGLFWEATCNQDGKSLLLTFVRLFAVIEWPAGHLAKRQFGMDLTYHLLQGRSHYSVHFQELILQPPGVRRNTNSSGSFT